ncbi:restriction endonuclease subunit S [Modestobacter sp. VKM Ac-2986]|uniref:restriction endonuclease subunit S n=1 Tax=Modestobacter sp. VKM Ac-2986 TaxID=3004140 RepID=UPI0022ABC5A0|nr:restriction endonuclease subunit S [Modestobacter sp. VKM Ac-2986]MCZ2830489.1 restriction endonuclease subunit S [Modestobacter sp. VKM Ac-2986]
MTWPTVSLGDICVFKYGKSLPASARVGGAVPVYGSNGQIGTHSQGLTAGPTIVIGRKGSFGEIHYSPRACWPIDTTYYIDEDAATVDLRWLAHRLPALGLTTLNRAAAVPGLNRDDAYRQQLQLPSLNEQRRIATILNQAERLALMRVRQLEAVAHLQQSIFTEHFGHPATWPQRWPMVTIGELAESIDYGTSQKSTSTGDLPVLRMGNLSYAGELDLEDLKYTELSTDAIRRYTVRRGDLLFNRTNSPALVGKTAVVDSDRLMAYAGYLIRVRLREGVQPDFVSGYLNSSYGKAVLRGMAKSAVSQANINAKELRAMRIARPSVEAQRRYVNVLRLVKRQRDSLASDQVARAALVKSLQARAFSGQL